MTGYHRRIKSWLKIHAGWTRKGPGGRERSWQQGEVLLADLGKAKEPNWGKSYTLGQSFPLELLLQRGTLLTYIANQG